MAKKLVLAIFMTLDGYIEGPNSDFVPPPWSPETANKWADHNLAGAGHLIYGRVSFQFNKSFWTSEAAVGHPLTAVMNRLPKTVVSRTLSGDLGWNGSSAQGDLSECVARLKASLTEKDIYCFGGAGLATSLMSADLVDEYRLMVTPSLLGGGKRLFEPGIPKAALTLVGVDTLDVGSVILHYQRIEDA
jgi:dihydrofolate reductase